MNHQTENWLSRVFAELIGEDSADFSGLGLIFYHPPLALPVLPIVQDTSTLSLPTCTIPDSIALLRRICSVRSRFHDGFHLVDAHSLGITHVSQFFSPPLPDRDQTIANNPGAGARFMAAYLGSLMPQVALTATLSKAAGGTIFINGSTYHKPRCSASEQIPTT